MHSLRRPEQEEAVGPSRHRGDGPLRLRHRRLLRRQLSQEVIAADVFDFKFDFNLDFDLDLDFKFELIRFRSLTQEKSRFLQTAFCCTHFSRHFLASLTL